MLDRILQLLARGVDFSMKHVGNMAIRFDFHGDFSANDAKTAGPGLFSTTGLSRVSDFATRR
jgi:hypothetical protein